MNPAGLVAFSLELLTDPVAAGYRLNASGRFSHREDYVRRCLEASGFDIVTIEAAALRMEMLAPVEGIIVLGQMATTREDSA